MLVHHDDEINAGDIEEAFKNTTRIGFNGEVTTLSKEFIKSIHEVERKFRLMLSVEPSNDDDLLDPRLYLNTVISNVKMDSLQIYDIKICKLIGDEIVDTLTDCEGKEIFSQDYVYATERRQCLEIEFYKGDSLIHTDIGFFLKPRYRKELHLYTRGEVENDKYAFAIVLKS